MMSKYFSRFLITAIKNSFMLILSAILLKVFFTPPAKGSLDINQYCKAFDENFRPIICLIKNGTQQNRPTHSPPPPPTHYPILEPGPDYMDTDDDEEECSCELTCIPRIVNQRSLQESHHDHRNSLTKLTFSHKRSKRATSTSYRCRSCGTECPVSTNRPPTCYCAVPATKSECTCAATCATFRYNSFYPFYFQKDDLDDANCILTVTALEDWRLGEERPPYLCECKRSKAAEETNRPDFICICERVVNN